MSETLTILEMDDDGYPEEESLKAVREWPYDKAADLFPALERAWNYPDYISQDEENPRLWSISTGGWSGHEDLIRALMGNQMIWMLCWVSSRRGGHHQFEVPEVLAKEQPAPPSS